MYGGSNKEIGKPGLVDLELLEKVAEIMDKNTGKWRLEGIDEWLLEEDYKAIQEILICQQGEKDRLIWPFTKNGEYTVRSGYHKAKEGQKEGKNRPSSSHLVDEKVWKIVWKGNLPSKIQNFLWRICSKAVLVGELLWKKRVLKSLVCVLYVEKRVKQLNICCWFVSGLEDYGSIVVRD